MKHIILTVLFSLTSWTQGTIRVRVGASDWGATESTVDNFSYILTTGTSSDTTIQFQTSGDFIGILDNVSVQLVV